MARPRLQPKEPREFLPYIRETSRVVDRLRKEADRAGIPVAEAVRQILVAYSERPWPLLTHYYTYGAVLDNWVARVRVDADTRRILEQASIQANLDEPEALRRILRGWLAA